MFYVETKESVTYADKRGQTPLTTLFPTMTTASTTLLQSMTAFRLIATGVSPHKKATKHSGGTE